MILYLAIATLVTQAATSIEKVAQHRTPQDCWVLIDGKIYDLTTYLSQHEKYTDLLPSLCGKDATLEWKTKGERNKPHSKKAQIVLKKYLVSI